jgi:hypothetical protein
MDILTPLQRRLLTAISQSPLGDSAYNKLSALFDRAEPKDFVDVYFICQEVMPFARLIGLARQKHVGIDDYWLAVALRRITAYISQKHPLPFR